MYGDGSSLSSTLSSVEWGEEVRKVPLKKKKHGTPRLVKVGAEDRGSKARERVPLIAILSYRFRHPVRDQSCVWRFLSPLASQLALTERRRLVW